MKYSVNYNRSLFWAVLSAAIVGGIIGIGSAMYAVQTVNRVESVQNGPWQTINRDGTADQNRWLRTAASLAGLFTQRGEEAIYYTAFFDGEGERLREGCVYFLTGRPLPAGWWSVTLYARDHYLIATPQDRWSVTADDVEPDAQGRIQIQVGGPESGGAWIPSDGGGNGLSLTLRLYDPAPEIYDALDTAPIFSLDRGNCA